MDIHTVYYKRGVNIFKGYPWRLERVLKMPVEFEISVVKVGNSLRMTIPKPITKAMNLSKGDTLLVCMTNGDMIVRKQVEMSARAGKC